jgi:hypothetical protein
MSDFVFCFPPSLPTFGFGIVHRFRATIGVLAGGPLEDFGEVVEQFWLGCQSRLEAPRQIWDTVGSGKAEPLC